MPQGDAVAALDRLLELSLALEADMRDSLGRAGLTTARAGVVWLLEAAGPSTQRDLAAALDVSPRNVTGLVDGLVQTGFVTREPHPSDRRAIHVTLTPAGAEVARELVRGRLELAEQLFGDAEPEELRRLIAQLDEVVARVRRLIADAAG